MANYGRPETTARALHLPSQFPAATTLSSRVDFQAGFTRGMKPGLPVFTTSLSLCLIWM